MPASLVQIALPIPLDPPVTNAHFMVYDLKETAGSFISR